MSKTSLIATLADLQTRRTFMELQYHNSSFATERPYLNSSFAMGNAHRERLRKIDRQIEDIKDAINITPDSMGWRVGE